MPVHKVMLNNTLHKDLKVNPEIDCAIFGTEYLLPINLQEFLAAATTYPIVFVKNAQTGQFQSVVIMGTEPGENLYCQGGQWQGDYTPEIMRNAPFSLGADAANKDELFLCINEKSLQLNQNTEEALFSENGAQTAYLKAKTEDVVRYEEHAKFTQKFIAYLVQQDVLSAKSVTIKIKGQPDKNMGGIYSIDAEKLNALPHGELERLREQGAMPVLNAQIKSLKCMGRLVKRKVDALSVGIDEVGR